MEDKLQSLQHIEDLMHTASLAAAEFIQYTQEEVDRIVRRVAEDAFAERIRLAQMAAEETGIGRWEDKVMKNVLATQYLYEDIRDLKTVGVISEDKSSGITEIAQPLGPVLAIIPVTNPTSTTIFKIMIALKTRNPVIICPSKKAVKCSCEAARVCYEAALQAGAPEGVIQWLSQVSREQTHALMSHPKLALILATGGGSLVNSAYSSGTPALGVGAGNVPVYIEKSADIPFAVDQIFASKTFDNGTICASEQALVVEREIAPQVVHELKQRGAMILKKKEIAKLEDLAYNREKKLMNADIVGKSAKFIADKADIEAPDDVKLLVAALDGVGDDYPLSSEILAPILAFYQVDDFESAVNLCIELNYFGGIGHTVSIFSNDEKKINQFAMLMNAGRIVVNTPSSQGAVGYFFNRMAVSLTLGCGSGGKNITTDNITARHLLNIQRIARRRENVRFTHFDMQKYYDQKLNLDQIELEYNKNC
ncbi:MAG: aldehyde dehydrogenase family protein [Candidatus Delongbacteria bacterium]|nr:aldehyde dehydrogenase family protein [Candidatus Delongbacteria bacterium]